LAETLGLNNRFQIGDVNLCEIDAHVPLRKNDVHLVVYHFKEKRSNRARRAIGVLEHCTVVWTKRQIEAQEKERNRIGRDLHDDIAQRLALHAKETTEILTDVQALSHELHSSKLEYLGIVVAMRSFCKEFGEQQGMEVSFR
jgi:signal transduction histidine kinase